MGLSVKVFSNIQRVDNVDDDDYRFTAFVIDEIWNYKIKNLDNGMAYFGVIVGDGISYPCSAHGRFREALVKVVGREDLLLENGRINWAQIGKEKKMPFYELIWFADNEGCLDFEISAILYKNFADWKGEAMKRLNPYDMQNYIAWMSIFEYGKEADCAVVFS